VIHIVIPVHNRKNFTRDCLISLRDQTIEHKTIIVDDGSSDGTREMLQVEFPEIVVIEGDGPWN
jgi:GT2 family glycosyltransferase